MECRFAQSARLLGLYRVRTRACQNDLLASHSRAHLLGRFVLDRVVNFHSLRARFAFRCIGESLLRRGGPVEDPFGLAGDSRFNGLIQLARLKLVQSLFPIRVVVTMGL